MKNQRDYGGFDSLVAQSCEKSQMERPILFGILCSDFPFGFLPSTMINSFHSRVRTAHSLTNKIQIYTPLQSKLHSTQVIVL